MYNAVIFDFDGTIADTKEGIIKGAKYALDKLNIAVEDDGELFVFVGPTLWYSFETFYGFDKSRQNEAVAYYREYYHSKGIYEAHLYDGIKELLDLLKQKNVKLGIASMKMQNSVEHALEYMGIKEYFHTIMGSLPDGTRSDKAELIHTVMEEMKLTESDSAVFVGDSRTDAIGADECNLDFIAALYDRELSEFDGIEIMKTAYSIKELSEILLDEQVKI